jgi:hypothetical protein
MASAALPPRRQSSSVRGMDIDALLRELRELLVRGRLFVEGLLQEVDRVVLAEMLREGARAAIAGDFIVLDALSGGDEGGILDIGIAGRADDLRAFLDQPLHRLARLGLGALAHDFEDPFQAGHVVLRLLQVLVKSSLQRGMMGCLRHFREGLDEALFRIVQILDLVDEQRLERVEVRAAE